MPTPVCLGDGAGTWRLKQRTWLWDVQSLRRPRPCAPARPGLISGTESLG